MKKSIFIVISLISATGLKVEFIFNKNYFIKKTTRHNDPIGDSTSVYDLNNDLIYLVKNDKKILSKKKFTLDDLGPWGVEKTILENDFIEESFNDGNKCKLFRIKYKHEIFSENNEEFNRYCEIPDLEKYLDITKHKKLLSPLNPLHGEGMDRYFVFESFSYSPLGKKFVRFKVDEVKYDSFELADFIEIIRE